MQQSNNSVEQLDKRIKFIGQIVFFIYLSIVIYTTLFTYNYYIYGQSFNLVPFDSIKLMWNSGDYWLIFKNVIGNILLFFPFGFLIPVIIKQLRSIVIIGFLSFTFSFLIEVTQYEYAERIFDIDDILLNGIGGITGYIVFKIGNFFYKMIRNPKEG